MTKTYIAFNMVLLLFFGCKQENKVIQELPNLEKVSIRYEPVTGIGPEANILRRDPSDVIFVDGLYYVWYTKVTSENYNYP